MDKTGFLKPSDIYVAIASNQNKIETKLHKRRHTAEYIATK